MEYFFLRLALIENYFLFVAKNKKDAKKITAKAALQALFGLTYPEEVKVDHAEDISMS